MSEDQNQNPPTESQPGETPENEPLARAPSNGRRKLPRWLSNRTSQFGFLMASVSFGLIVFLYVLDSLSSRPHPYMGLIAFAGLPPFLILGLLLMGIGALKARKRAKAGSPEEAHFHLDFNNPKHRKGFAYFVYGGILFFAVSAFGSYHAYEYTESVEFCGLVCHNVMKPEYTAYLASPHARVPCVKCHIGPGAGWYVKSKMSGAYQVYSTIFNKYERPIATPIANLVPAQETCEQCHWPQQFYSQKLQERAYYLSDADNTRVDVSLLMKIGGDQHGHGEGIHAHMYLDNEVRYVAADKQRQIIPYVEMKDKNGNLVIYRSTEVEFSDDQIKKGEKQLVDCIDCHNRPSHRYNHPAPMVNQAIEQGRINVKIPDIKRISVEALEQEYKTEKGALDGIRAYIEKSYKEQYPDALTGQKADLDRAVSELQAIYKLNYFPEMKVSWKGFPNNLDHMYSSGCFRCHDGKHVSKDGRVISNDCNSCHTILAVPGPDGKPKVALNGQEFVHPVDIGDMFKTMQCKDCHAPKPEEPEE